jgi:hypothetical protein
MYVCYQGWVSPRTETSMWSIYPNVNLLSISLWSKWKKIQFQIYCHDLGGLRVTYTTCSGLDDWTNRHLIHTVVGTTGNSALLLIYRLQSSPLHSLGFSVFISRILATGLSRCHCHFKSHMKPSFHSLIPFLPLFCSWRRSSIPLLPMPYPGRLAFRNSKPHCDWRSVNQ